MDLFLHFFIQSVQVDYTIFNFTYLMKEELKCRGKYDISGEKFNNLDTNDSPGKVILENHVEPPKRKKYRSSYDVEEFLANLENSIVDNKCFLVEASKTARTQWKDFVVKYSGVRKKKCRMGIIIDVGDMSIREKYRGVDIIDISNQIKSFDYMVFNLQIVSELDISNALKMYLADIMVAFTDGNLEESVKMAEVYREILTDTQKCLSEMKPDMSEWEITRKLWQIQLKHVFPVIEDFRIKMVRRYKLELQTYMPENPQTEKDEKPEEVELGELYYLIHYTSMTVSQEDYRNIDYFRNGRNILAHHQILKSEDVIKILE